jgi:serine/threonine protein kinase
MIERVYEINQLGFMHRDIKPDNFILEGKNLLNEPEVSLIDFGFMT